MGAHSLGQCIQSLIQLYKVSHIGAEFAHESDPRLPLVAGKG